MTATLHLADRTPAMDASAIREILKVVSRPGMISLAGGIPAPECFPMTVLPEIIGRVLTRYADKAFQYDASEGFMPLREALTGYLEKHGGVQAPPSSILIGSGSQGILDGIGKILISPGDRVAVEAPTYLGAIQAFNPYQPRYVRLETDQDGLIPDSLERVLKNGGVKFVYLVPTFQNPTGRTLPPGRREEIARLIQKHDALLIEDDPYSPLRYHGDPVAPIKTLSPDNVVYISTLSKVFAPGLRIGFCVAPEALSRWLVVAKQGVDLHSGTFSQALAAEYLTGGYLDRQLPRIRRFYAPRRAAMLEALDRHMPTDFKWSRPRGGMFIWLEGPPGLDMEAVYQRAIRHRVAFVPGRFFFTRPGEGLETARLNFTVNDEKTIDRAVSILADVINATRIGRPA
jgi:2-aminoadipate transaminase